ncbi:YXWGXW repeat-containing protein [Nostoc sp. FACHB-110]|uniref:YXWGXW repeat-containing protein n=1 Tax=Nostoc sp. FACHB-110 TaxID=2692834 RepID=UPI0016849C08|nr:YXWGXW repeat-containing protein [Nostoc sp. FACHB-110]MBD2440344.1 YXWGXW repeat-containing protein [Nostoc sp. FACHB-110]
MLKRILAGTLLALPLSIAAVQTQASAAQVIVVRPNNHRNVVVRKVVRQRWVPGHWERTPRGRHWVPGHYQRY